MWRDSAACRGFMDIMFNPARTEDAKAICASCPVINKCRLEALNTRSTFGVWGGQSEGERHHIPERLHNGVMIVIEHENGRLM